MDAMHCCHAAKFDSYNNLQSHKICHHTEFLSYIQHKSRPILNVIIIVVIIDELTNIIISVFTSLHKGTQDRSGTYYHCRLYHCRLYHCRLYHQRQRNIWVHNCYKVLWGEMTLRNSFISYKGSPIIIIVIYLAEYNHILHFLEHLY